MCNAWNHSIDCKCGWGGEGHLGRRTPDSYYEVPAHCRVPRVMECGKNSFRWSLQGNFNEPTRCPICGGMVYFIRHNGGSVWLDCLGYPWDKHACFDAPPNYRGDLRCIPASDIRYQKQINRTVQTHKMLLGSSCPSRGGTLGIIVEAELHRSGFIRLRLNIKLDRTLNWFIENRVKLQDIVGCMVLLDEESNVLHLLIDGFVVELKRVHLKIDRGNDAVRDKDKYVVGERIKHSTLGIGTITAVERVGRDYKVTVRFGFPTYTTKKFLANIAHVEKLQ